MFKLDYCELPHYFIQTLPPDIDPNTFFSLANSDFLLSNMPYCLLLTFLFTI